MELILFYLCLEIEILWTTNPYADFAGNDIFMFVAWNHQETFIGLDDSHH